MVPKRARHTGTGIASGFRNPPRLYRAVSIKLQILKLRKGNVFPSLLDRRRRAEKALMVVIQ
ncbi:MAG: transposase [Hydrogenibacillus schlegelii]|uniref:Transposase n=1 Tax=Hydrogenibacillus schlegelii TaxID=1484 RepID=A0A947CYK1_HYDSH|nr:transposase [Hydrogenibacillus schlegelii]MBT9283534.1 transposase [Hydrogenibacillus schlegelii]